LIRRLKLHMCKRETHTLLVVKLKRLFYLVAFLIVRKLTYVHLWEDKFVDLIQPNPNMS